MTTETKAPKLENHVIEPESPEDFKERAILRAEVARKVLPLLSLHDLGRLYFFHNEAALRCYSTWRFSLTEKPDIKHHVYYDFEDLLRVMQHIAEILGPDVWDYLKQERKTFPNDTSKTVEEIFKEKVAENAPELQRHPEQDQ